MNGTPELLLGLDLGGSGVRCLLVDVGSGEVVRSVRTSSGRPAEGGGVDLDLESTWARVGEVIREGLARAQAGPECVVGVGAASFRFGSVALDAAGEVVLAAPNNDARGVGAGLALAAEHGEALERETGHWPAPIGATPRWLALAPEARERVRWIFSLNDWLAWRMTGEVATDPTHASGMLLFDPREGAWARDWVLRLGLDPEALPPVCPCGTRLGGLRADAAEALGLTAGTPVAVGGGDTQLGLVGLGVLGAPDAAAICGTTMPVQAVVDPAPAAHPGLWLEAHAAPGALVLESNAGPAGDALDWLGRLLDRAHEDASGAARLLAEAAVSEPGAGGMLSTFGAQVMDGRAMAFPIGELSLSHLLEADPRRAGAHLARSVVEGLAFALRANLEQLRPVDAGRIVLGGRMVESALWPETVAAVLGRPVEVGAVSDATGLGAALCAGVAAGRWRDLGEAAAARVRTTTVEPDPVAAEVLGELHPRWQELQAARRPAAAITQGVAIQGLLRGGAAGPSATRAPGDLRILVTADLDDEALASLRELGQVEYASYREARRLLTGASLVEALADVDVFVTEIDLVDGASLPELPRLRVVASCRGDAVNVDVEACSAVGIPVLNAPGRNADAVADLTVAFLLSLARKLPEATAFLRDPSVAAGDMGAMGRAYGTLRGDELWRRTVGLVGLGAVGRKVAARLRPFGVRLRVFDPWQDPAVIARAGGEPVSLETLLAESDFVSLHAAVTEASMGLIGEDALARMKPSAALVNTARAALVDEDALVRALREERLAGAALDVFSVEPPGADHPLLALPNVIATPHVGGNTHQIGAHQGRIVSEDLARLAQGEAPRHALNPETAMAFDWATPRAEPDAATRAFLADRPPPAVTDLQKKEEKGKGPPAPAPAPATTTVDPALREELSRSLVPVLEAFLAGFAGDPAVGEVAAGQDVTLYFVLEDLGLDFHLRLREDASAARGAPDGDPEVTLRLRAEVLDGMFTGRRAAMDEAMAGRLSFRGDAAKAMTLQQLEADLRRLYEAARAAAGPPGDLSRTA